MIYVPCDTTFLREVYILSDEFFFSGLVWWSVPLEQFTISWTLVILTNFNPWAARLPPSVKINVYDRKSLCQAPPKIDQSPKTCIEKHVLIGLKGINTVPKRLNSFNFILNFFFEKNINFSIFKVYLAFQPPGENAWRLQKWRFRRVGLRWAIKNHPFLLKKWFFIENLWGFRKIFCSK